MTYELNPKTITLSQADCDEMLGLLDADDDPAALLL